MMRCDVMLWLIRSTSQTSRSQLIQQKFRNVRRIWHQIKVAFLKLSYIGRCQLVHPARCTACSTT